jgi:hypothetical protein
MSATKPPRQSNVTLRVDADTLTWARTRAMLARTSVNALIRRFLDEYAAVLAAWREGLPPPWTPGDRMTEVMDPVGAGHREAGRGQGGGVGPDAGGGVGGRDSPAMEALEAELLSRQS